MIAAIRAQCSIGQSGLEPDLRRNAASAVSDVTGDVAHGPLRTLTEPDDAASQLLESGHWQWTAAFLVGQMTAMRDQADLGPFEANSRLNKNANATKSSKGGLRTLLQE